MILFTPLFHPIEGMKTSTVRGILSGGMNQRRALNSFSVLVEFMNLPEMSLAGNQSERQSEDDPQGAEGAVHHLEQMVVLVVGSTDQHFPFSRDDFIFKAGVMNTTIFERHLLQGAACDSSADGDSLQFMNDGRNKVVFQCSLDQIRKRDPGSAIQSCFCASIRRISFISLRSIFSSEYLLSVSLGTSCETAFFRGKQIRCFFVPVNAR